MTFRYLDWPGPIPIAHRGAHGPGIPENSMASFEHAVRLGYRYVETDVHGTPDGRLVVVHDGIPAGPHDLPYFEDVLGTWPDLRISLDPKNDAAVEPLLAMLAKFDAFDRVCIGAVEDARLRRIRAAAPRLCTSLGPRELRRLRAAAAGLRADGFPTPFASVRARHIGPRYLRTAQHHGIAIHAWTVDTRAEMLRLLDAGVDGIYTDRPELLRDVLIARGQWVTA